MGYSPWGHKKSDTTEQLSTMQTNELQLYATILINTIHIMSKRRQMQKNTHCVKDQSHLERERVPIRQNAFSDPRSILFGNQSGYVVCLIHNKNDF